ncbi:MAG: hypothetical protein U0414_28405 [Polyangiaceae bacterium]
MNRGAVLGLAVLAGGAAIVAPRAARADDEKDRIVLGAVMAPGMALVGGGFALAEKLFSDAADDHLATVKANGGGCTHNPGECKDIDDDLEAADNARVGEIVCFSTSGALLVTGIALIVEAAVSNKSSASAPEVRVSPWASFDGGGAAMQVRF